MHRATFLVLAAAALSSISILGQAPTVTVFEGARVIVGDGRAPIENATFIVEESPQPQRVLTPSYLS